MKRDPLYAPPELMTVVKGEALKRGSLRRSSVKVVPEVQVNPFPNQWTPKGAPRWIARCPECPGCEVVPETGLFVCGSCGAEVEVNWEGVE